MSVLIFLASLVGLESGASLLEMGAVGLFTVLSFVSGVGLWRMKKWSFGLFLFSQLFLQVLSFSSGGWTFEALLLPGLFSIVIVTQYKFLT